MAERQVRPRRAVTGARGSVHTTGALGADTRHGGDGATRRPWSAAGPTRLYRPLRLLGRGSFGVVLLAEDVHAGRAVAVKRVRHDARLHSREVEILGRVLVDDPLQRTPPPPASVAGAARATSSGTPVSAPSPSTTAEHGVVRWPGTHHPNVVELLDSYVTYDTAESEHDPWMGLDVNGGHGGSGSCGGHGADVALATAPRPPRSHPFATALPPTVAYLEMVMSYLPVDLSYVKRYYRRHRRMPTTAAGAEQRTREHDHDESHRRRSPPSPVLSEDGGHHLPLRWVRVLLFQLARALAFLHARHVCHRDVKPANVIVDPDTGRLQLCDFGSAKVILQPSEDKNVSYICSRYYRAPELLFGALHYGSAVDMWSFGCLAAELLRESGEPLFRGCTSIDQMAELFKVLGAPSKREMYAMNPHCAEALLRTRAMHHHHHHQHPHQHPHHVHPHDTADACEEEEEEEEERWDSGARSHGYEDVDAHDHFTFDSIGGDLTPALGGVATTTASSSATNANAAAAAASTSASVTRTTFDDYYDVLKVRAIPWRTLLHVDTPTEAVALVASLLCYTPEKRLTAAEVVEHVFFDDLFAPADDAVVDGDDASAALRLPNGRLMPLAMFQVTEVERRVYTDAFLARMARQATLIAAAMEDEERAMPLPSLAPLR
ncbi:protein kinase [Novymonas esmeraldas]|uniref:Protein kinase n=1 Tax=Novymonas esmeraldas TaxID=1808958 RepID=A0AAW0ESE9_9TRYP